MRSSPFANPSRRPNTVQHGKQTFHNPFGSMANQFMASVAGTDAQSEDNASVATMHKVATDAMTNYAVGQVRTVYEENKG